jgi:predicted nucleic acid-binding protein
VVASTGDFEAGQIVVDTMLASAILVGNKRPKERALLSRYSPYLRGRSLVLSFATVAELRYGTRKDGWKQARTDAMEKWFHAVNVVTPDDDLVTACAHLRAVCFQNGHGLHDKKHDSDRWIAATALRYDLPLVSDDRIFANVPDLVLLQA